VKEAQSFQVAAEGLSDVKVEGGKLEGGVWTLEADAKGPFKLQAQLPGGVVARETVDRAENWEPQELVTRPAQKGRRELEIPAGYSLQDWISPVDLLGREQLFEPTGIAVAKDGTIVLSTRTAGVWRIRDGKWSLFAESTYEALGVWIEDDKGDVIVIAQKPELTRLKDLNGDGRAEVFETVCDDYGFHGNYHEYTHGPVRDSEGNYYFLLNLSHAQNELKASWKAGGKFMGSMGGYRGWACRVTPEGKFEPYAMGLRSPAGLGIAPDGRIWYAENQGEYVGSSKVVPLEQGKFYGHISGLVSLPGMKPDDEKLTYELWKDKLRKGAVWLPHGMMANSPGSPAWDQTGGSFGPFKGQMFIGDQTLSQVMRVTTEQVGGEDQGSVVPFAKGLASGVMRPVFLPDGSLLLGQTGRGWGARGGSQAALQLISYDGETVAADISEIVAVPSGLELRFTRPIAEGIGVDDLKKQLKAASWFYTNLPDYGSPRRDQREETVSSLTISPGEPAIDESEEQATASIFRRNQLADNNEALENAREEFLRRALIFPTDQANRVQAATVLTPRPSPIIFGDQLQIPDEIFNQTFLNDQLSIGFDGQNVNFSIGNPPGIDNIDIPQSINEGPVQLTPRPGGGFDLSIAVPDQPQQ
jgi:hypothetical protein